MHDIGIASALQGYAQIAPELRLFECRTGGVSRDIASILHDLLNLQP
ncbi:MAG: hypothetical protein HKP44_15410 [Desulfofustis sp.]|nr:hypothetical protein [Desulfofustis sp.]